MPMMGRAYTLSGEITGLSAAKDIIRITAGTNNPIRLQSIEISQTDSETAGQVAASVYRASTAGTGTSRTPRPMSVGDSAFLGTAVVNLTADTTKSPAEPLWENGFDLRAGVGKVWVPGTEPDAPGAGILVVRIEDAPPGAVDIAYTLTFIELG